MNAFYVVQHRRFGHATGALALFAAVTMFIAMKRYRQTLD